MCKLGYRKPLDATDPERLAAAQELARQSVVAAELAALAQALSDTGTLILSTDTTAAYDTARRSTWSFHDAGYPCAIVQAGSIQDVQTTVKAAAAGPLRSSLKLAVRCGGHGAFSVVDNSLCLDMAKLNTVTVDLEHKTVTAQGGCRIRDVDEALQGTGLGFVTGTHGDTGVTGLTLGGGMGYLSRLHGYACDNLMQAELVTAAGQVVTCSDTQNADLMRGLRGGGGNFGVVTQMTFQLHDVSHCFGGMSVRLTPTQASAAAAVKKWRDATLHLPDSHYGFCALPSGGVPVAAFGACTFDESAQHASTYKDIPSLGYFDQLGGWMELENSLKKRDYHSDMQTMLLPVQQPKAAHVSGVYLGDFGDHVVDKLIHLIRSESPSSLNVVILFTMGGALERIGNAKSVLSHREHKWWAIFEANSSIYDTPEQVALNDQWLGQVRDLLLLEDNGAEAPYALFEATTTADIGNDQKAYAGNIKEVAAKLKGKWDPNNLFSLNKNIAPTK